MRLGGEVVSSIKQFYSKINSLLSTKMDQTPNNTPLEIRIAFSQTELKLERFSNKHNINIERISISLQKLCHK